MNAKKNGICVSALHKHFEAGDSTITALSDINLTVKDAGITALMGPSGSGKSTLLNIIGALDSPTSGEVIINGINLSTLSLTERSSFRNQTCGFIFQNFNLIPVLTTLENILLPAQLSRKQKSQIMNDRATSLLEIVGLKEQVHQSVNRLSGGQQQRVAVARALINDPAIILADEPTANLDQATSEAIMDLLKEVSQNSQKLIVMATHDQSILPYCSRVVKMRDGRIISDELRT